MAFPWRNPEPLDPYLRKLRDGTIHPQHRRNAGKLAPHEQISQYRHNRIGEDSGDAQLKNQAMGRWVTVAITDGNLDFGPLEQIFYGEFDDRGEKGSP